MAATNIDVTVPNGPQVITVTPTSQQVVNVQAQTDTQVISIGIPGTPGPAPNLTIGTVTTGTAAATITGTNPNYVLNLTLPGTATPDASTTVKGIVQLTNHLGGTATAPTVRASSATQTGIVELADNTEIDAGTDTTRAVTPAGLVRSIGARAIAKSGDTLTGTLNFPSYEQAFVPEANMLNKQHVGNFLSNVVGAGPFSDLWHDVLAFSKTHGVPTVERSVDGTSWTAATLDNNLFAQKQNQSIVVLDTAIHLGCRWTWNSANFSFSNIRWLVLGVAYNAVQPTVTVKVETSTDGITWTLRHTSSYTTPGFPYWFKMTDVGGHSRVRVTLTADALNTGVVRLASMKMMSFRWGDQGGGAENELPFDWNGDRGVTFQRAVSVNTAPTADELVRKDYVDGKTWPISALTATGTRDSTTYLRGDGTWTTISAGGAVTDASTTAKGIVQLAGDLAGTAAAPTVPGLAGKAASTITISAGTGLTGGGDLTANRTLTVAYGSTAGTAVQGNDIRVVADGISTQASIRTLGTGAQQAAAGNHTHAASSETVVGMVELATAAETTTGTDTTRAVHPAGLKVELDKKANLSAVEGIKIHDGTASGGVRPTGYVRVVWVSPAGAVHTRPTNMVAGDIWEHD